MGTQVVLQPRGARWTIPTLTLDLDAAAGTYRVVSVSDPHRDAPAGNPTGVQDVADQLRSLLLDTTETWTLSRIRRARDATSKAQRDSIERALNMLVEVGEVVAEQQPVKGVDRTVYRLLVDDCLGVAAAPSWDRPETHVEHM